MACRKLINSKSKRLVTTMTTAHSCLTPSWSWAYVLLLTLVIGLTPASGQRALAVTVVDGITRAPVPTAIVYIAETNQTVEVGTDGQSDITFLENFGGVTLTIFAENYASQTKFVTLLTRDTTQVTFGLSELTQELDAVTVIAQRERNATLRRLRAVEGTAIYAGKKTEVISVEALTANKAANQARQLYAQVSGLNIYESDDAGLQLSIGGRGLDPNRTASFNTRQNGYDISADVLGYPESYYTPPAEALREIQVVRGAASLQYGTQFGGLINFVFRRPATDAKVNWVSRQTVGSYGLLTSFNSLSGTVGKVGYYGYYNYKTGNGFRPNSGFDSHNAYLHVDYALTDAARISLEYTHLDYLAQQAGGLTDAQFYNNPLESNRSRNWFEVDWRLWSARYEQRFGNRTNLSINVFGLNASRGAVGFRTNRVSQADDLDAPRDLIVNTFDNVGTEARLLHRYRIGRRNAIALIGVKAYRAENSALQGPGTASGEPDFSVATDRFPSFPNQSNFDFPNRNLALFGEQIIYLNDHWSVTPGARYEYINTASDGSFRRIDFDLAGNPIRDTEFIDSRTFERNLLLLGLGVSYRGDNGLELYGNVSQNYRSVTFNDIRTVNPSFQVDPDITDESGYTADAGLRWSGEKWEVHGNLFGLRYRDRIGEVLTPEVVIRADGREVRTGRIIRRRGNIGSALIYGVESLLTYRALRGKSAAGRAYFLEAFANTSLTRSTYTDSEVAGVTDNEVEFIPLLNLKTGLRAGYGNLVASVQYSYLSGQFTDASNAGQDRADNQSGIVGKVPAYGVADISLAYRRGWWTVEGGVNNFFDARYFTRRATGYPGPGIIPAAPIGAYLTLGVDF